MLRPRLHCFSLAVLGLLAALPAAASSLSGPVADTITDTARPPKQPIPPVTLTWDSPAISGFWARAESPQRDPDDQALRGLVAIGQRVPLLNCNGSGQWCDGLNLSTMPVLRGVPDAPERNGGPSPAIGAALLQEASLNLNPGLQLRASAAMGDRLGIGAPLVAGAGVATRVQASVVADLSAVVPLSVDMSLAYAKDLSGSPAGQQPNDCEAVLRFSWLGRSGRHAPLSFTLPCGEGSFGQAFTFGLRGEF